MKSSAKSTPEEPVSCRTVSSQFGSEESKASSTPLRRIASCLDGDARPITRTLATVLANWVAAQPTTPECVNIC